MQQSKLIRLPGATDSLSSPSLCTAPGTSLSWAISAHKTSRKLNLLPSFSTKKKKGKPPASSAKRCWTSLQSGTVPLCIIHREGRRSKLNAQYRTENCPELRKLSPTPPWSWLRFVTPAKCHAAVMWLVHTVLHHAKHEKISEKNYSIIYIYIYTHTSIPNHRHPHNILLLISPSD